MKHPVEDRFFIIYTNITQRPPIPVSYYYCCFLETQVKVEYGSEIDTGVHGSAFPVPASLLKGMVGPSTSTTAAGGGFKKGPPQPSPAATTAAAALGPNGTTAGAGGSKKAEREWLKTYERSGWNINNLPVATGSMLHHLDVPVTGA